MVKENQELGKDALRAAKHYNAAMATAEDVRRIALSLPGVEGSPEGLVFSVVVKGKAKGFVWPWLERVHPKKARVPNEGVLGVMVKDLTIKEILLSPDGSKIFTEPHYNNYPAVLVRLEAIEVDELEDLIVEAWRCRAPKDLLRKFDEAQVG